MENTVSEFDEIRLGIEQLRALLESLVVRGLRACGTDELLQIKSYTDYLERAGAGHVAAILSKLHSQIEKDDRTAVKTLLQAQIAVRLLERVLTLKMVRTQFNTAVAVLEMPDGCTPGDDDEEEDQPETMQAAERKQLLSLLDELSGAVEELLLAGLTTASKSTVERLDVTFKEASRMKLLRLGSTLRIANEEISRFTTNSAQFSAKRLAFFLGRAWLLATSMRKALDANDTATLDGLMSTPPTQPLASLKVVTLGVSKRVVPGAFASFDFRFRAIEASAPIEAGEPIIWSCVFPMRKDLELPAEAFLHLPQKQKFRPSMLLEQKVTEISKCAIAKQPTSAARLLLNDASEMKPGAAYSDWKSLWAWDLKATANRLNAHRPTPLDLEIELQEEVFLDDWQAGERKSLDEGYDLLPLDNGLLRFEARLDRGLSGTPLNAVMTKLAAQKKRPPIYGVAHYEACRIVFQPLTALGKNGPEYLTVSPDKISQAELVKAMKFT